MTWLVYMALAIVLMAILGVLQRSVAVKSPNPRASSVVFNLIAGTIASGIFIVEGGYRNLSIPHTPAPWIFIGLACLSYGLFERFRFHTAKHLEASVLTVVGSWSFVVSFLGSLLLYRESVLASQWIGVGLILISVLVISWPHSSKFTITKIGLAYGFLTSSLLGSAMVFDKVGAINFSPELYSILLWIAPISVIVFPKINLVAVKKELARAGKPTAAMAMLNVFGYYFFLKALATAPATQAIPILQINSVLVVILAAIFLKERDRLWLKLGIAILALVGLSLVV